MDRKLTASCVTPSKLSSKNTTTPGGVWRGGGGRKLPASLSLSLNRNKFGSAGHSPSWESSFVTREFVEVRVYVLSLRIFEKILLFIYCKL